MSHDAWPGARLRLQQRGVISATPAEWPPSAVRTAGAPTTRQPRRSCAAAVTLNHSAGFACS
eukprot:1524554-Pyramimonas_sp.AAC.1